MCCSPAALRPTRTGVLRSWDTLGVPVLRGGASRVRRAEGGVPVLLCSTCETAAHSMSSMRHKPVICPVLIGRQEEVARLHDLFSQAQGGQGQLVLIGGEAGIGKSRLVAEVRLWAEAHGFLALQGSCFPADRSAPYAPLLDLFGSLQAKELYTRSTINLEPLARELALLHPGLVPLLPGQTWVRQLAPEQEKRRLFAALSGASSCRPSARSAGPLRTLSAGACRGAAAAGRAGPADQRRGGLPLRVRRSRDGGAGAHVVRPGGGRDPADGAPRRCKRRSPRRWRHFGRPRAATASSAGPGL